MTTIPVYILTVDDCGAVCNINKNYPRGPQIIICDYGSGPCVEESVIDDALYFEWYTALDNIVSFVDRSIVDVVLTDIM